MSRKHEKRDVTFVRDGGEFHYIDWGGSGPLLHIAHATGFCANVYTPIAEALKLHARVVGMDARGHGTTSAPADPAALRDWDVFTEDMNFMLSSFSEPVIAVGHSLGGVVSMILAARRPELIKALVLIDPTILPYSWMWWWFLIKKSGAGRYWPIARRASRRRRVWPDKETVLASYRRKKVFQQWSDGALEAYIEGGVRPSRTHPGKVELCCDPEWESRVFATLPHNEWSYVSRVKCPILVVYGKHSDAFLPQAVKRFSRLAPRAIIRPMDAGHLAPMERPGDCAEAIVDFLRSCGVC